MKFYTMSGKTKLITVRVCKFLVRYTCLFLSVSEHKTDVIFSARTCVRWWRWRAAGSATTPTAWWPSPSESARKQRKFIVLLLSFLYRDLVWSNSLWEHPRNADWNRGALRRNLIFAINPRQTGASGNYNLLEKQFFFPVQSQQTLLLRDFPRKAHLMMIRGAHVLQELNHVFCGV